MDERHHVRILEDVLQLVLDVPEVDVDHHGTDLEHRDHGLDGLDGVARIDPHLVARLDSLFTQVVTEAVGPILQLRVGEFVTVRRECDAVGDEVDGVLYEVCDI